MEKNLIIAFLVSFAISAILCPVFIPLLKKLKFGQNIRQEGPQAHLSKAGTPTMGGIVILISIAITTLLFVNDYREILPVLFVSLAFGIIGFLDDYIKVVKKRNLGLRAYQKFGLQLIVTIIFFLYILFFTDLGTQVILPLTMGRVIDISWLYYPMFFIFVLGTVNAVNLTDGIDGLASGVTIAVAIFFTAASIKFGSNMEGVSVAVIGSLLGFLIFNVFPARIFMGDTGSLGLGGFVVGIAVMMKMPIFIIIIGFIYLIEVVSVMIQVLYFKKTNGKRFFKMAPIHHHFEHSSWHENRVTVVFTTVTIILCFIAYITL